ncbi:uncharacterized protein LOC129771429 [Toxorhynchites rutilus septentrionalis]|uniref:uncharacterized protein LOC129771429 n=1 Tax=Toxorhynchites rutilus septentrionalis TaxID=329112 RepID=UPI00247A9672|nr:uncharacterized protein LOC129771429 [Toxorhynchites rutilus septentrionalis]
MKNLRNSEMRRSSTAGLNAASQRPPLPPKIETRCHSYDGLLEDDKKRATEGQEQLDGDNAVPDSVESTPDPGNSTEESMKTKNRRSRSMDDLFDDKRDLANFLENTQSMENLLSDAAPEEPESPIKPIANICLNRKFVESPEIATDSSNRSADTASPESYCEQPCANETITVDSTPRASAETDDDVLSTNSSLNSFASSSDATTGSKKTSNSPFINKYVKKVKSLMKK